VRNPERLHDLYQHQQLDISAIAQMASCAKDTVRRLLQHDGIPLHRPPDISRAWLETEYHHKRRDLQTLARERHINPGALAALATRWGIPVRRHGHDALAHLDLSPSPSPAIRAVATGRQGLHRLKTIVQTDGHDSIATAAHAIYNGRESALRQRLAKIEHLAGFKIFHRRTTPITPTERGREFLAEATKILHAQEQAGRTVIPPNRDQLHTRKHRRSFSKKRQPDGGSP
jgi:hypothetical protein